MPPKKKVEEVKKVPLGRPGNNLKLGVIGVPNCGKTSVFNFLSKLTIEVTSQPFQTTESKEAKVNVPDDRFIDLCQRFKPASEVPAQVSVVDTCGIVNGSTKGEGMGMQFVSNIQETDSLLNVARCFEDDDVCHLEETIDPVRDLTTIQNELIEKDLSWVDGQLPVMIKANERQKDKVREKTIALLQEVKKCLDDKKPIRTLTWNPNDIDLLNSFNFLSAKSQVYLLNLSEKDFVRKKNKHLAAIARWVKENDEGSPMIPICAPFESEILAMDDEEAKKHCVELGEGTKSMRDKVIQTGYHSLLLQHFFTVGPDEVRAWTIRQGCKAPQAAGVVHSDMEKGFISADIYTYKDLVEQGESEGLKGETALKAAGKLRQQGKTYEVLDGDICHFAFNPAGKKK